MAKDKVINYKYRDLKIFGSTEWLANNEKKYRQVYDLSECTFIYCELSFFNKLFDEKEWDVKINLKCVKLDDSSEICTLTADRTIKKDENIVYIREGWGVKSSGTFWKKGSYRWEAWVDGVFIAEKAFYILDIGLVTETENPYFNIKTNKLYEATETNIPKEERNYLSAFDTKETRYVWLEMVAENLVKGEEKWPCELIFNFKTRSSQLKGSVEKLFFVEPIEPSFECSIGWGNDLKGTWGLDYYTIEVIFMDQLVASILFDVGNEFLVEQKVKEIKTKTKPNIKIIEAEPAPENIENIMQELDHLIGLDSIKKKIKEYTTYLNFLKIRKEKGFDDSEKINLHAIFTGNPGTGKTTVAKMLGKIYLQLGLLSKGHVIEADRSDLVAEYIGQTAPKTKEIIKRAKGGILFIDEAYALARKNDDSKDFGKEAIEILLKEMSDGDGDIAIIAAGYPDEMNNFLESNPGMKSRFQMFYDFPDYLPKELLLIAEYSTQKRGIKFNEFSKEMMFKKLIDAYRDRDRMFGNARYVNSLIDECKMNMGLRLMQSPNPSELSNDILSTIETVDIEKVFGIKHKSITDIPIDEELLLSSLQVLHSLIGLNKVKNEIDELVKLVRFYREIGKDVRQSFSLHTVFTGNPGTGKTTVARILAQIYKALGILERGNLVECDRQDLVGGFVGQTALKTNAVLNKAMGGVLFIDEAYALSEGGENDFGKEAVETILKKMEDVRGDMIVIVAGYTDNMKRFLESNPGLNSRFDREMQFEDYDAAQLHEIAIKMLANNAIKPTEEASNHLKAFSESMYNTRNKFFGNARSIRKVVEEAIKNQHLRLAKIPASERTSEMIFELVLDDVLEFKIDTIIPEARKSIGFN